MAVVKATAIAPNPATRDSLLAQAQAASADWNSRPEREATVLLAPEVSPLAIRAKCLAVNDAEGNRIYGILETRMVAAGVTAGSSLRLTLDDETLGNYREW